MELGPELPAMMGAIIGIPLMLIAVKFNFLVPRYVWSAGNTHADASAEKTVSPLKAWMPYVALAVILLISRLPALPFKSMISAAPTLNLPELFNVKGTANVKALEVGKSLLS